MGAAQKNWGSDRDAKLARYAEDNFPAEPEGIDEVLVDLQCPRCKEWIYPTARVGERTGYKGAEHDLRCGCLMNAASEEDQHAYLLELEALIGAKVGGPLTMDSGPGVVGYDRGERLVVKDGAR